MRIIYDNLKYLLQERRREMEDAGYSRAEVNAAITKLILSSERNEETANIVIRSFCDMKSRKRVSFSVRGMSSSSSKKITGHTPEHGNVEISQKDKKKKFGFEAGEPRERVGHYKIWQNDSEQICFANFWKLDEGTESFTQKPDEYVLGYDKGTLAPLYLGVMERTKERSFYVPFFNFFVIFITYKLRSIWGEIPLGHRDKDIDIHIANRP